VLRTDSKYCLHALPHGNEFDYEDVRREYAEAWGFQQFAYDMAIPWWERKLGANAVDQLIFRTRAVDLVKDQPAFVETIIAKDDPFDTTEDMDEFIREATNHRVTVLDRGGHLGYVGNDWTRAKLISIFHETAPGPVLMSVSYNGSAQGPVYSSAEWRRTKKKGFLAVVFGQ
jgi:hypothetical protein